VSAPHWLLTVFILAMWWSILCNVRSTRRMRQLSAQLERRCAEVEVIATGRVTMIAEDTGLSELQVQVAMDAAMAQFYQRLAELPRNP
jgi:hypothetical protein